MIARILHCTLRALICLLGLGLPARTFAADFVGNQACAACHSAQYRSYLQTPMARSSGKVGGSDGIAPSGVAEFRDQRGAFSYTVQPDYRFVFRELAPAREPAITGSRTLSYFVGSGTAARTFLLDSGGFLFESPVTYYRRTNTWNASPGFAGFAYPNLTRPIAPGCLQCHASWVQPTPGTLNSYATKPFLENGVACERCHGAGGDHVRFFRSTGRAGQALPDSAKMVNPAKLAPAARDSVCAQCHLSGEVRVPKTGKPETDALVPGQVLDDLLTVFVRRNSPSDLRVTSHVENLAQSACKRASGDKLWCATCHDPHAVPEASVKASYFREKCLTCHKVQDCGATQATRQANGDNCTACHMPSSPAADVEHVVFTDHSIRRRPNATPRSLGPTPKSELVPYFSYTATTRDLGLAYAMVALRDSSIEDRQRGFELLRQAADQGTADATALVYLAEFYRDARDDAHALPIYEQVWRMDRTQYAAAAALGAYRMQSGRLADAIELWQAALAINPGMTLVRVNLAEALLRSGRRDEARAMVTKALELNPSSREARELEGRLPKQ